MEAPGFLLEGGAIQQRIQHFLSGKSVDADACNANRNLCRNVLPHILYYCNMSNTDFLQVIYELHAIVLLVENVAFPFPSIAQCCS